MGLPGLRERFEGGLRRNAHLVQAVESGERQQGAQINAPTAVRRHEETLSQTPLGEGVLNSLQANPDQNSRFLKKCSGVGLQVRS